jgi:hypothetical protein
MPSTSPSTIGTLLFLTALLAPLVVLVAGVVVAPLVGRKRQRRDPSSSVGPPAGRRKESASPIQPSGLESQPTPARPWLSDEPQCDEHIQSGAAISDVSLPKHMEAAYAVQGESCNAPRGHDDRCRVRRRDA